MEVIRDSKWEELYRDSNAKDPDEIRIRFADVMWRTYTRFEHNKAERKKRSLKIIEGTPTQTQLEKTAKVVKKQICQSITLTGKPCQFKAVSECGRFCKKHNL